MNPLARNRHLNQFRSHITIFFLLCSILPIASLLSHDIKHLDDSSIGSDDNQLVSIKKMKESIPALSSSSVLNNASVNINTLKIPSLAVGDQIGDGGGIYQVYDSLLKINSSSLDTQDSSIGEISGDPDKHDTTITLSPLNNFTRNSIDLVIQDVIAEEDWRIIENDTSDPFNATSTTWLEVGQKFNITDNFSNITSVEIYLKYFDVNSLGDFPHGNISIFTDSSGKPGTQLGTTTLEDEFGSPPYNWGPPPIGPAWVTYTFPKPINVTKGSYWLVLNDTGNQAEGYWEWYGQDDSTNGDTGDWAAKSTHGGSWTIVTLPTIDILSAVRVLPTDANWNRLSYSNPKEVSMTYNSDYELTSFFFKGNNTDSHDFSTNTSVSFTIQCSANYTNSYPLTVSAKYQVQNGSIALWNLTFSTIKVNTTDTIQNRHIALNGIQADWNGSKIYWNDSKSPKYTELTNNVNVTWDGNPLHKYTNGNTTMVINTSDLIENVTWHILFNTTNYISSFILEHQSIPLSLPLRANVTDIIDLNYQVGEPIGNASYWIEYRSTSAEIVSKLNISYSNTLVSTSWDINNTLDQTRNINGTYDIQVFWISMDKVKVGTFTRTIDLFVNTSFNVQSVDTEMIIDDFLNVTAVYKSIHNNTDLRNAQIWCDANWTTATDVYMNQIPTDHSYNASFSTEDQIAGTTGTVTITTQVSWFVNWTKVISVHFVENSSLKVNTTNVVLEWGDDTTLRVDYNKSDGTGINGATITVAGVNITKSTDVYFIQLNSTQFPGTGSYTDIVIVATKINFHTRMWYFNLTIIPARTDLTANIGVTPILNNSKVVTKLSQGSRDNITLNVLIYHFIKSEPLNISEPLIDSPVPLLNDPFQESNLSWSFIFNPVQSGVFTVRIEFDKQYYVSSNFIFQLEILKASTSIVSNLNTPENIYFTESIDFFLLLNNTDYNELITGGSPNINATSIVSFINSTNDCYWFRFDSSNLQLGFHVVNITFSHSEFTSSNIILIFNVITMPTAKISLTEVHLTNNGTVQIEDDLEITLETYRTYHGIEITHLDSIELWLNSSSVSSNDYKMENEHTPFKIILHTLGWRFGSYNLSIQISTLGYQAQVIQLNITLNGIPTEISVDIEPGKNIQEGQDVKFIVTLKYQPDSQSGIGAGVNQQIPLSGINVSFSIEIKYKNDTMKSFNYITQTDDAGQAVFTIDGHNTKAAIEFTNITIKSDAGLSSLQSNYSMPSSELATIRIFSPAVDIFQIIGFVLLVVATLLFGGIAVGASVQFIQKKRETRKTLIQRHDLAVEQSFEDIKSIRLILARHESGLQFYVEKTLSEFQTDPDALSGMSTAISSFIGDVAGTMQSRDAEDDSKKSIETISREGFYMLIWNGKYSSIMIISEAPLPDYFKERLTALGNELEKTFQDQLKDIFTTEQFPASIIKKMVRKHIALHYFSAFVLNEGILTLKKVKLSRKDKKMLSILKEIHLQKNGLSYLFSEQIISRLERKYKRSEAIEFFEKAISWNLLVELTQEEQKKLMS
ncbi:MAG: hypothetical protein ACFFFH_08895 [Candidatus Thorarchaeota archaeon]